MPQELAELTVWKALHQTRSELDLAQRYRDETSRRLDALLLASIVGEACNEDLEAARRDYRRARVHVNNALIRLANSLARPRGRVDAARHFAGGQAEA